jgi:paraquat-inducible protein B
MARRSKMVMLQRKGFALMNLSNRPIWLLPVITAVIAGLAGAVIIAQGLGEPR